MSQSIICLVNASRAKQLELIMADKKTLRVREYTIYAGSNTHASINASLKNIALALSCCFLELITLSSFVDTVKSFICPILS